MTSSAWEILNIFLIDGVSFYVGGSCVVFAELELNFPLLLDLCIPGRCTERVEGDVDTHVNFHELPDWVRTNIANPQANES